MDSIILHQKSIQNAVASVEMEGYTLTEFEKSLCMDALCGKISKDEFIKIMLERCLS